MGAVVAERHEKGLVHRAEPLESLDGERGLRPVVESVIGRVGDLDGPAVSPAVGVGIGPFLEAPLAHQGQFLFQPLVVVKGLRVAIDHFGSHVFGRAQIGLVEGDPVRHMIVEDLSHRDRVVAELVEVLGHGDHIGNRFPELLAQAPDAGRVGPHPGHQARARRGAGRRLTESPSEKDTLPGQPVEVWRHDLPVSIAAQFGPQVIDGDEKDVRPAAFIQIALRPIGCLRRQDTSGDHTRDQTRRKELYEVPAAETFFRLFNHEMDSLFIVNDRRITKRHPISQARSMMPRYYRSLVE